MSAMHFKTNKHQTLCWECTKNAGKCSWSRNFTPVKDWNAVPTKLKSERGVLVDSFDVYECPEFELVKRGRR